jgi:hypothetical protein
MVELFFQKIIRNQKGSMDKILVTLLLVIVSVGALAGLSTWALSEKDNVKNTATEKLQEAKSSM